MRQLALVRCNSNAVCCVRQRSAHLSCAPLVFARINKKNSQKDVEQKKNGNYFFFDDGADEEEDEEFDDI
jgi:hypothetical protein